MGNIGPTLRKSVFGLALAVAAAGFAACGSTTTTQNPGAPGAQHAHAPPTTKASKSGGAAF